MTGLYPEGKGHLDKSKLFVVDDDIGLDGRLGQFVNLSLVKEDVVASVGPVFAKSALVRLRAGVNSDVLPKSLCIGEALATVVTFEVALKKIIIIDGF